MDFIPPPPPMPDLTEPSPVAAPVEAHTRCGHCSTEGAKNKCLRCLKVVYCSAECQKGDWKFHKRVCEPPKKKEDAPPPPRQDSGGGEGASAAVKTATASSTSAPAAAASSSSSSSSSTSSASNKTSTKNTQVITDEDLDAEDLEALAEVKKAGGYRVHWRKAEEEAKIRAAVGSIAPKAVDTTAAQSSSPTPIPTPTSVTATQSSAWNTAGTMEQRHMGGWVKDRLVALLGEAKGVVGEVSIPEAGSLRCTTGVEGYGEGCTADILLARGKTKKVYDLKFAIALELYNASASPPTTQKVLLQFLDVSNDTAGEPRAIKVEFEGGGASEEAKGAVKRALGSGGEAAHVLDAVRKVVEDAVAGFMDLV